MRRVDRDRTVGIGRFSDYPPSMTGRICFLLCGVFILLATFRALGQAPLVRVTPGELVIDPPTLINLGFEWIIEGDSNRNQQRSAEFAQHSIPISDGRQNVVTRRAGRAGRAGRGAYSL